VPVRTIRAFIARSSTRLHIVTLVVETEQRTAGPEFVE
jgi:hypothetical protein